MNSSTDYNYRVLLGVMLGPFRANLNPFRGPKANYRTHFCADFTLLLAQNGLNTPKLYSGSLAINTQYLWVPLGGILR